jgi:integrase
VHLFLGFMPGGDAMPRPKKPFTVKKRNDSKTFQFTINPTSGLPRKVCLDWQRRSFQDLPDTLAPYRIPKNKTAAESGVLALIQYLEKRLEQNETRRAFNEAVTVGEWARRFTEIETSLRTAKNANKNKPYSLGTLDTYKSYYNCHIKNDPFANILMSEVDEDDVMTYTNRLSLKNIRGGNQCGGSRTFAGVVIFLRMCFTEYRKKHKRWFNPFQDLDAPQLNSVPRDSLPEDEFLKLFEPGVLRDTMELAVCACMFLSGLRRGEIAALKPDCLDWSTPKITVKYNWQRYNKKTRFYLRPKARNHGMPLSILSYRRQSKNFGKKMASMNLSSASKMAVFFTPVG